MGGAERGCGTIFRGSGRTGATGGVTTVATGAAGRAGAATTAGGSVFTGAWLCRASCSSFCLLANMAFITSPGLET
jgi:hypothetical protein